MDALNAATDVLYMASPRTTVDIRFGANYDEDDYNSTIYKVTGKRVRRAVTQQLHRVADLWPNNTWYQPLIALPQGIYFPPFTWSGIGSVQIPASAAGGSDHLRAYNPTLT